jgi:hypothetical protein
MISNSNKRNHIQSLMKEFALIPGAKHGSGPLSDKPESVDMAMLVDLFFREFPALLRDQGFVEFMNYYSGALIVDGASKFVLDIPGPSRVSRNVSWDDISVIRDKTYYPFCFIRLSKGERFDFSFSLSENRTKGIYVSQFTSERIARINWYCLEFSDLLTQIVIENGKLNLVVV